MENIPQRLQEIRKELKLTQEDIRKKLNLSSKQTYSSIEKGRRKLHIDEVSIYKNLFNINPNWLLFGEGNQEYIENIKESELVNLIVDFRSYGGEVDIVKIEIIKKILSKFYQDEYWLLSIIKMNHSYGNRFHTLLINILKSVDLKDIDLSDTKNGYKTYLHNKIEYFDNKSTLLPALKKRVILFIGKYR